MKSPLQAIHRPEDMTGPRPLQFADAMIYVGYINSLMYAFIMDSIHQRNPKHSLLYHTLSDFEFLDGE